MKRECKLYRSNCVPSRSGSVMFHRYIHVETGQYIHNDFQLVYCAYVIACFLANVNSSRVEVISSKYGLDTKPVTVPIQLMTDWTRVIPGR